MTIQFKRYGYFTALIGSVLSGLFVYIVLTYLLIAPKITIPSSIAIFGLIFGLTIYYSSIPAHSNRRAQSDIAVKDEQEYDIHAQDQHGRNENLSNILFVVIFGILIIISSISYTQDFHIFTNWENIDAIGIVQLGAAIMLCFFIPGYGIVLIITKKYKMDPVFVVILSYLFSMLLTGLIAYISVLYFDSSILESKYLFIVVYLSILVSFLVCYPTHRMSIPVNTNGKHNFYNRFMSNIIVTLWKYLRTRASELVVFGSLILLFVTSTYLLYGGLTIGDQWFHQGRALLFVSGSFREAALSYADTFYPPFQSGLLAALTTLSGIPLVNSYASIAFLNVTPMFAFYYFFLTWVPRNMKRAGLLACSLFILSSGFGWIYLLSTLSNQPVITEHSNLETLRSIGILDILRLSNFGIPTSPDFSTGLIYIALPAGFVLLGMLRTTFQGKIINIFIVMAISILGIISHYEFYLFIIIASLLPIIFKMKKRNYVYVAFLGAISLVYLMDVTSPGSFFTSLKIIGFPLLLLTGLFIMVTWAIYLAVGRICKILESISISLKLLKKLPHLNIRFNYITITVIVFLVAYGYLLCFIVLSQLSLDTIRDQSAESTIPWYLYPMRLGITGLLGLAFILSYLYQKFEKQVFVFGVMIAVALFTGPYYSENRFSKYIMVAMVGFASLMFYKLLLGSFEIKPIRKPISKTIHNVALIGIIIVCSGLSTLIFIGYGSLILQTQDYINTLSRRHFPSISEVQLYESLYDRVDLDSKKYNVISFPREYERRDDGVMTKVSAFAGLPEDKLRQSPLTLNASSLDALYSHLYYSDARYILLPKADIDVAAEITKPTRFAIDHFKPIYENNDYILLEVPYLVRPTSSNPDVALVHNDGDYLLSHPDRNTYDQSEYYNYYYPLSILALSRATYDVFSHNDLSVFSKNVILVPDVLNVDNYTFNNYLNYVRQGGKLIVINSDNSFNGTFSKLFQMPSYESKPESFTSVTANKNQNVLTNITGLVKRSEMKQLPDVNVVASYRNNNNQTVAPFVIEKKYPNNGSLLLINAEGYFNTILNSPRQYFNSLANITEILALDSTRASISENTSIPMKGFRGNMEILGKIRVNSSSLSFLNDGSYPYLLNVTRLTITNKTNNSPITLDNVLIKSLKIIGDSEVIINHTGKLNLPGATSDHNYISMLIPSKFDMTVHIEPQRLGHMEIVSQNHFAINAIKISNGSKVDFHNIEVVSPIKFVQVMLKNPELTVNGSTTIEHAYFNGYVDLGGGLLNGDTLDFQGVLKTKLDFVDHYNKPYRGGISTEYITYLQSVDMNGTLEQDKELLRLPLDVNIKAITEGQDIPWTNILMSTHNFVAIIVLSLAAVVGVLFGRRYVHRYYQR